MKYITNKQLCSINPFNEKETNINDNFVIITHPGEGASYNTSKEIINRIRHNNKNMFNICQK